MTGYLVLSDANICLRLAQEDAAAIEKGDQELVHDSVSPSRLIYQGLEFEDLQYAIIGVMLAVGAC